MHAAVFVSSISKTTIQRIRQRRNAEKTALIIGLHQRRDAKNRRRAVSYVSTGLARLPRDINARASTAEERLYMSSPALQIIYTTALRR